MYNKVLFVYNVMYYDIELWARLQYLFTTSGYSVIDDVQQESAGSHFIVK